MLTSQLPNAIVAPNSKLLDTHRLALKPQELRQRDGSNSNSARPSYVDFPTAPLRNSTNLSFQRVFRRALSFYSSSAPAPIVEKSRKQSFTCTLARDSWPSDGSAVLQHQKSRRSGHKSRQESDSPDAIVPAGHPSAEKFNNQQGDSLRVRTCGRGNSGDCGPHPAGVPLLT